CCDYKFNSQTGEGKCAPAKRKKAKKKASCRSCSSSSSSAQSFASSSTCAPGCDISIEVSDSDDGCGYETEEEAIEAAQQEPDPDCGPCCQPDCAGKTCGPDNCGGSCGTCVPPSTCNAGGYCDCNDPRPGPECGPWIDLCGDPRDNGDNCAS